MRKGILVSATGIAEVLNIRRAATTAGSKPGGFEHQSSNRTNPGQRFRAGTSPHCLQLLDGRLTTEGKSRKGSHRRHCSCQRFNTVNLKKIYYVGVSVFAICRCRGIFWDTFDSFQLHFERSAIKLQVGL